MLQGLDQLKYESNLLIITKSKKDVMVYDLLGYESVAPHSEALSKWEMHLPHLQNNYDQILINFDNDEAGYIASESVINKYSNLIPLFIPIESNQKDISDYIKSYGINQTINNLKKWLEKL
jgi:DNA primase